MGDVIAVLVVLFTVVSTSVITIDSWREEKERRRRIRSVMRSKELTEEEKTIFYFNEVIVKKYGSGF